MALREKTSENKIFLLLLSGLEFQGGKGTLWLSRARSVVKSLCHHFDIECWTFSL